MNNAQINEKICWIIESGYLGEDSTLAAIMKIDWQRLQPGKDNIPYNLKPMDTGVQIYFETECLSYRDDQTPPEFNLTRESYLISEDNLSQIERGLHQNPDDWTDHESKYYLITDSLPDDIEKALIKHAKEDPDPLMRLIWSHDDYEGYIKSIANSKLRMMAGKLWKKHADEWI